MFQVRVSEKLWVMKKVSHRELWPICSVHSLWSHLCPAQAYMRWMQGIFNYCLDFLLKSRKLIKSIFLEVTELNFSVCTACYQVYIEEVNRGREHMKPWTHAYYRKLGAFGRKVGEKGEDRLTLIWKVICSPRKNTEGIFFPIFSCQSWDTAYFRFHVSTATYRL